MNQDPSCPGTDPPASTRPRSLQGHIRKKRVVILRDKTEQPTVASKATPPTTSESSADRPAQSQQAISSDTPSAIRVIPFKALDDVPYEPAPWQSVGLLKKTGVTLLVTAPGACSFALCAYFAAFLSGRGFVPFGPARYPGDVLFTTHTPDLDRAIRAALSSGFPSEKKVLTRCSPRRFNWKKPSAALEDALLGRQEGAVAAVIVDAGPFPQGISEETVDAALDVLKRDAEGASCLLLLVVESTNRSIDPFERIPKGLRSLRGTLLAAPLRSKTLTPQEGAPAEFLLMRLGEASPHSLIVRFRLGPAPDLVETTSITWGVIGYRDPREAFRMADTVDLTNAQRAAVQLAADVIRDRGPTTSRDLQAAGRLLRGIPLTTMRDALSVAKLLGHLDIARSFDGRSFWIIPGVTQIPSGMYLSHGLTEEQMPF